MGLGGLANHVIAQENGASDLWTCRKHLLLAQAGPFHFGFAFKTDALICVSNVFAHCRPWLLSRIELRASCSFRERRLNELTLTAASGQREASDHSLRDLMVSYSLCASNVSSVVIAIAALRL